VDHRPHAPVRVRFPGAVDGDLPAEDEDLDEVPRVAGDLPHRGIGVVVPRDEDAGEAASKQGRLGEARVRDDVREKDLEVIAVNPGISQKAFHGLG